MDTKLINSRLLARRDVKVWFFDGGREHSGPASCVAENGVVFTLKPELPRGADPLNGLSDLCASLKNRTVSAELVSPKIKIEVKMVLQAVKVVSARSSTISVTATFVSLPDAQALKVLLEPTVTQVPRKG